MPRMISDDVFNRIVGTYESGALPDDPIFKAELDALRSAPSVELLDLGRLKRYDVVSLTRGSVQFNPRPMGRTVRFSDLQSLVTSNHDDQIRATFHKYFSMFTEMTVKDVETFMESLKIGRGR